MLDAETLSLHDMVAIALGLLDAMAAHWTL